MNSRTIAAVAKADGDSGGASSSGHHEGHQVGGSGRRCACWGVGGEDVVGAWCGGGRERDAELAIGTNCCSSHGHAVHLHKSEGQIRRASMTSSAVSSEM